MSKIVRLTESDLIRLVKKVIKEQNQSSVAEVILNNPKVEKSAMEAISQMSQKDIGDINKVFNNLGLSPNSSLGDIKNVVDDVIDDEMESSSEMTEEGEDKMSFKRKLWKEVQGILFALGFGNLLLFAIPFSAIIDELWNLDPENMKSIQASFVISLLLFVVGSVQIESKKKDSNVNEGIFGKRKKF